MYLFSLYQTARKEVRQNKLNGNKICFKKALNIVLDSSDETLTSLIQSGKIPEKIKVITENHRKMNLCNEW
jgi:hypothetical protein